jgi:hypothetical protein
MHLRKRQETQPVHGELLICPEFCGFSVSCYDEEMRDLVILFVHLIVTVVRLARPGVLVMRLNMEDSRVKSLGLFESSLLGYDSCASLPRLVSRFGW